MSKVKKLDSSERTPLPQYKLKIGQDGKIQRNPTNKKVNIKIDKDENLEAIRRRIDFSNLQTQLGLMERENIIQTLDEDDQKTAEEQQLSKSDILTLRGQGGKASRDVLSKKEKRYAIIRDNLDIEEGMINGNNYNHESIISTVRGLVGEKTNNQIDDVIGEAIFEGLLDEGILKLSDWMPALRVRFDLQNKLSLEASKKAQAERKKEDDLIKKISKSSEKSQQQLSQQLSQSTGDLMRGQMLISSGIGGLPPRQGLPLLQQAPPTAPPPPKYSLTPTKQPSTKVAQSSKIAISNTINMINSAGDEEEAELQSSNLLSLLTLPTTDANINKVNKLFNDFSITKNKTGDNYSINNVKGITPSELNILIRTMINDGDTEDLSPKIKSLFGILPKSQAKIEETLAEEPKTPKKRRIKKKKQETPTSQTGKGIDGISILNEALDLAEQGNHDEAQKLYYKVRDSLPEKILKKARKYLNSLL